MTTTAERAAVIIAEPGIYEIDEDLYHGDPVPGGSLSSTGARHLLPPSCPAKFLHERTRPVFKAEFDFGSAAHKVILGSGPEVEIVDAAHIARMADEEADPKTAKLYAGTAAKGDPATWMSAAASAAKESARAAGKVPVLAAHWAEVLEMRDALLAHPFAGALFDPERGGHPEQSLFWPDGRHGIWKRSRLDWLPSQPGPEGRLIIPDYKTGTSAEPRAFARSAGNYGYHMQADFYLSGVAALLGAVDARFVFVIQEKTPPYIVTVCELDDEALEAGHIENEKASALFRRCSEKDDWPGYCDDVARVSLPRWAMPREDYYS